MTVAVLTGVPGMDSSYLTEHLLKDKVKVYGLYRRSARNSMGAFDHPSFQLADKVKLIEGDVTDATSLEKAFSYAAKDSGEYKVDYLYHLAANSFVGNSHINPSAVFDANAIGTINTMNAFFRLNDEKGFKYPKAYFAATSECFSGAPETAPQNEETLLEPQSPYAISKVAGVHYCHYLRQLGRFVGVGFLFNHSGARRGHEFVEKKVVWNLCKAKLEQIYKFGMGNLDSSRDWSHARDMTRGMVQILQQDKPDDFVLASGQTHTIRELITIALKILNLPGEIEDYVYIDPQFVRPTEVWCLHGDASKAKEVLGWEPKVSFEELVQEMIEWDMKILKG